MSINLISLNLILAFSLGFTFILVVPFFIIFFAKKRIYHISYIILYLIILLILVLLDVTIFNNKIHISFTITNKWFNNKLSLAYFDFTSILINLFLLFPLGCIIPCLTRKKILIKILLFSLFASIYIELLQFSLPINRSSELLDVLNNLISGILGYLYYLVLIKIKHRGDSNDKLSKQKNNK